MKCMKLKQILSEPDENIREKKENNNFAIFAADTFFLLRMADYEIPRIFKHKHEKLCNNLISAPQSV